MKNVNFRAWDKKLKVMAEVISLSFYTKESLEFGGQTESFLYYPTLKSFNLRPFSDIELMQYTGLKDKNSKEIFEGDIIEIEQGLNQKSFRGSVVYDDYMFDIEDFYLPYYDYPTIAFSEGTQSMVVIGNIYNNPELLKGE